jgi:hypothetical protein
MFVTKLRRLKLKHVEDYWYQIQGPGKIAYADVMGKENAAFVYRCMKHEKAVSEFLDTMEKK